MMRQTTAGAVLVLLLTACSAGSGGTPVFGQGVLPNVPIAPATATGTVKVTIHVPPTSGLTPRYVSPSTRSIVIKAYSAHGKLLASSRANLRAGVKYCKRISSILVCTFKFSAAAGKDRFSATTYDRAKGKGKVLSTLSNFELTVKAGKTVKLPLALDGIVHSVSMELTGDNTLKTGSTASGFKFAGLLPQTLQVAGLDADGNIIVGAGAPIVGLTSSDTTHISISRVSGTTNDFLITPHSIAADIALTASAKPGGGGATLQSSASLSIEPVLYVANFGSLSSAGNVAAYASWSAHPVEAITNGIGNPGVLALDGSGNLWVGNEAGGVSTQGSITKYAPGSTTPSRTISGASPYGNGGNSVAVDSLGNVYCACNNAQEVDEYTPSDVSGPSRSLNNTNSPGGISTPYSVAVDSSRNLYVANGTSNAIGIAVYPPSGMTPSRNISSGINGVSLLAFDKSGNLYAGNYNTPSTITEYGPGSSTVANTFESSGLSAPEALAVDSSGNVYASNYPGGSGNSTILEYTQTSTGSPTRTFTVTGGFVWGIALDPIGNLYVPVSQSNVVYEYPAGMSTTPIRTLASANGISNPQYVLTWP
jgi:hypothetical protein